MKLSEAILNGARLKSQVFNKLKDKHGTCAMGAAYQAIGVNSAKKPDYPMDKAIGWGWIHKIKAPCVFCEYQSTVANTIMHMNDTHHWKRENIANWVRNIEDNLEDPKVIVKSEVKIESNVTVNK